LNSKIALVAALAWFCWLVSCDPKVVSTALSDVEQSLDYESLQLPEQPNILWLVAEDLSPYLPAFGDSTIVTANLDRLAAEGVKYPNLFSPSGVCAPSRAAIALGMYPTRSGSMHMRTGPWASPQKDPPVIWRNEHKVYEALPPAGSHMHSTYLRRAGYYTSNNAKQDYQFQVELTAWDESSNTAHWRNRPDPNKPFFSIFNFGATHESQIWARANDTLLVTKDLKVKVPPYLQDTKIVRTDLRRMYSNILAMDKKVGEILAELEADGLLENTIIFWYGDHGGMLPRSKRTLFDTGINTPLMIRFPNKQLAGNTDNQLLSFVDFLPTILSLAGVPVPEELDGKAWLGQYLAAEPRTYIHAAADNFDQCCEDRVRAVRDSRFKYIRNLMPDRPYYLPIPYREQMASMQEMLELQKNGLLDSLPALWFRPTKAPEELFDTSNDPYELTNLANNPEFKEKLNELRQEMDRWLSDTGDKGLIEEGQYLNEIWSNGQQPVTSNVIFTAAQDSIQLSCETTGAAMGYQWLKPGENPLETWKPYTGPIAMQPGKTLVGKAHRIGYLQSSETIFIPNNSN
jgi:N-sulfoglucosamine sulfohydrolase